MQRQLADSARRLSAILDDNWKRYLALPAEVYAGDGPPSTAAMNLSLGRFNEVAANPQYQSLAQRPEFQDTFSLLKKYCELSGAGADLADLGAARPPK